MTPLAWTLSLPVRAYRLLFSPWVGMSCRYQPTCSQYALEALEKHGGLKGSWLALKRIGRCHPLGSDDLYRRRTRRDRALALRYLHRKPAR